jgi:hypothetical protein
VFVEVAGAVFEIEDRTGLVIGELFEEDGGFIVFVENARSAVAWEPGVEAGEGSGYACADALGFFRVGLFERDEAFS